MSKDNIKKYRDKIDLIDKKKNRIHFNEFMLNFHDFAHEYKNKNEKNFSNILNYVVCSFMSNK